MENLLLKIIERNTRLTLEELAAMTGGTPDAVAEQLDEYRRAGIIHGTRTLIDWEKVGGNGVHAMIEVRVSPKKDHGFDEIAEMIANIEEVDSVWLMSGGYDLLLAISGATFQEVAMFVSRRLSPLDDVLSTATHFVLRTYKKDGAQYLSNNTDEREIPAL